MKVALAQLNPTVGDLAGNRKLAEEAADRARQAGAELVVLPELALTGYPPLDLLERDGFVRDQLRELDALAAAARGVAIVVGAVLPVEKRAGKQLVNAAVLLQDGARVASQAKSLLPTYDVFDENRYFVPAEERSLARVGAHALGLTVCEDAWVDAIGYTLDPVGELAQAGAELVLNVSASPFHVGKAAFRRRMLADLAAKHTVPIAFVNQVGGNDELVFDGGSCVVDARGRVLAALPLFEPAFEVVDLDAAPARPLDAIADPDDVEQLAAALVLGIRDYFRKQNLPPGAVVGLSGGIDSAVTAWLAVEALGARAGARRRHARPVLVGAQRARRLRAGEAARHRGAQRGHPARLRRLPRALRAALRREARLRHRAAEHPGPDPRRDPDGDLERRGPARARDREQERAVRRLLHALRRHGGRPRRGGRRLQARRLRARAAREPGRRAHPGAARSRSRPPPSWRRASSTATTFPRTTRSTPCSRRPSRVGSGRRACARRRA